MERANDVNRQSPGLRQLEMQLAKELSLLNYPPSHWLKPSHNKLTYDVVIIGAGMAGLTAAFALCKQGITHIQLFDENQKGKEGPWSNYARMLTLRSGKSLVGPAFDIPSLTFHSWFEAQFGAQRWEQLGKIPTRQWGEYLNWYRQVLQLPVQNDYQLISVIPVDNILQLTFKNGNDLKEVLTQKLVLATGRAGFGGLEIPAFIKQYLPKESYFHTNESIDFKRFLNKKIAILGVGASAFDAAAACLHQDPKSVMLIARRKSLPIVNKTASLNYPGFSEGYYRLPDEEKARFFSYLIHQGGPPPVESLQRVQHYPQLSLKLDLIIEKALWEQNQVILKTNKGLFEFDYLILATGFKIDGTAQSELKAIMPAVRLWKDRPIPLSAKMGAFPYLGSSFQFLEKEPKASPYLQNIYCFNYAATLSHGHLTSDIPEISVGARRLAQGIAGDFFVQEANYYYRRLEKFSQTDIDPTSFSFIR